MRTKDTKPPKELRYVTSPEDVFLFGIPTHLRTVGDRRTFLKKAVTNSADTLTPDNLIDLKGFVERSLEKESSYSKALTDVAYRLNNALRADVYASSPTIFGYSDEVLIAKLLRSPDEFAVGVEFEMELKSSVLRSFLRESLQSPYTLTCPFSSNWLHLRRDGSLREPVGVEVITSPLPKELALNPTLWKGLLSYLRLYGYAKDTYQSGLHVHLNAGYITSTLVDLSKPNKISYRLSRGIYDIVTDRCINSISEKDIAGLLVYFAVFKMMTSLYETNGNFLNIVFGRSTNGFCIKPDISMLKGIDFLTKECKRLARLFIDKPEAVAEKPKDLEKYLTEHAPELLNWMQERGKKAPAKSITGNDEDSVIKVFDNFYDRLNRHAAVNLRNLKLGKVDAGSQTIEFRHGAASLNFSDVWTIVCFVYGIATFARRAFARRDIKLLFEEDYSLLSNKIMTWLSIHGWGKRLRDLSRVSLATQDDAIELLKVPKEHNSHTEAFTLDVRG